MTGRKADWHGSSGRAAADGARAAPRCSICGHPVDPARRSPLCSQRCVQIDLGRWLGGGYRIVEGPAQIEPPLGEPGGEE